MTWRRFVRRRPPLRLSAGDQEEPALAVIAGADVRGRRPKPCIGAVTCRRRPHTARRAKNAAASRIQSSVGARAERTGHSRKPPSSACACAGREGRRGQAARASLDQSRASRSWLWSSPRAAPCLRWGGLLRRCWSSRRRCSLPRRSSTDRCCSTSYWRQRPTPWWRQHQSYSGRRLHLRCSGPKQPQALVRLGADVSFDNPELYRRRFRLLFNLIGRRLFQQLRLVSRLIHRCVMQALPPDASASWCDGDLRSPNRRLFSNRSSISGLVTVA